MKTRISILLGAALCLLVTFGSTQHTWAQTSDDRIIFSGSVTVKDTSSKGKPTYTTTQGIFTINPDGTGVEQLTDSGSRPKWSPDRQYIAYSDAGGVRVMEANGGRSFPVFSDVASTGFDWSPDGTMICFPWYGQGLGIIEVDPATGWVGEPTLVWGGGSVYPDNIASWPSWSPDGSKIVFMTDRDIPEDPSHWSTYLTILDLASGEEQTLYERPAATIPQWSPDGYSIAFSGDLYETITKGHKTTTYHYREIFITDAGFSEIYQVTDLKGRCNGVCWSSDGTQLAFTFGAGDGNGSSLSTMSLLTGDMTSFLWTVAGLPDWSPY